MHGEMWSRIELSINVWFLFELSLRIIFCGDVIAFFKDWMNLIDILAIVPYFFILLVRSRRLNTLLDIFKTLKFLRVCRLFRFSKHSKRLKVAGKIIESCMGSFRVFLTCFCIGVVFGGTVLLNMEEGSVDFDSIPTAVWWCVQTLTTVGYGDLIPRTLSGRLFACGFMLLGVVTTSLPILTIVTQFVRLYPKNIQLVSGGEMVGGKRDEGLNIPRARFGTKSSQR